MPGFVKTPKDEARWSKAKEAAGKQTKSGSESYWKLSNYIYHKMGKTEEDVAETKVCYSKMNKEEQALVQTLVKSEESNKLSTDNLSDFSLNSMPAQQSILGNEVEHMSDEKKYTAREAAVAVLKKAEEVLKKSALTKAEPKGEIHPEEPQAGESEHPGKRIESQVAPDKNPKEQAEGNNELAGTTPTQVGQDGKNLPGFDEMRGHIKLAKFIGHMQAKRKKSAPGAM